jgi:diguanylate cyclase (GGDEF)-like protein/PAS domain S-box-containing protein
MSHRRLSERQRSADPPVVSAPRPSQAPLPGSSPPAAEAEQRARTGRRATEALLREHPDAVVFAQSSDGLIVPPPASMELAGHPVLTSEGRSGMDLCVAEDRMAMVKGWMRVKEEAVAQVGARLCSNPEQWMVVRMLDLRKAHGVIVNVVWPTSEAPEDEARRSAETSSSTTPRFCTRKQDEEGNVIDCDEAYLQMFGHSSEEVIGKPTFERVHAEDQARVIEGWIATVATGRVQMFRVRMKRQDGSWLWVDTTLHNYLSDPVQPHVLAECIDVSAEMSAQEALHDREELLRNLIEEMPDGLLQLDCERRVVYHNARLLEILWDAAGAIETRSDSSPADESPKTDSLTLRRLLRTLTAETRRSLEAVIERALDDGVREDVEVEARLTPGTPRHILMKVRPLQRESGVVTGVIASVLDVTDSARARRELEKRATFDALTGARNRASIMGMLAAELERSSDTGVVYVDLDQFKTVNDTLGHAAGDEVLVHVAECLKASMRSGDELGRLGGDEFVVLLRGIASLEVAMSTARRLSKSLRGTCELSHGSVELCASVGVACVEGLESSAEELIERADMAMYRSKEQRRGVPILAAAG